MTDRRARTSLRAGIALLSVLAAVSVAGPAGAATQKARPVVTVLARPHAVYASPVTGGRAATAKVRVAGRVAPVRTGRVVLEQRHGSGWLDIGRASISSKGLFAVTSRALAVGRYTLRVVEAASISGKAVAGSSFSLSVLAPRKVVKQPEPAPTPTPAPAPAPAPVPPPVPAPAGPTVPHPAQPVLCSPTQPATSSPDQLAVTYVQNPVGYVGRRFGTQLLVTGGVGPYYYLSNSAQDSEGLAVAGINVGNLLNGPDAITGVPRAPGVFHRTVTVIDSAGHRASTDVCLQFVQPLRLLTTSLPAASVGSPYSVPLVTDGGFAPVDVFLPPTYGNVADREGLYVHGGDLTGDPLQPALSTLPVTAEDGVGTTATSWLTLTVGPLPAPRTLHVPGDAGTISAAIAEASPGDTILVGPGTYRENLDYQGKALTIRSSAGPSRTEIVAAAYGPTVLFANEEPPQTTLQGFTVQGFASTASPPSDVPVPSGFAVDIEGASPTVEDDVIEPTGDLAGVDVSVDAGAPQLLRNTITGVIPGRGPQGGDLGVEVTGATQALLQDNDILAGNLGVYVTHAQSVSLQGNLVSGNEYDGMMVGAVTDFTSVDDAIVQNDTSGIVDSYLPDGVAIDPGEGGQATVVNDTIADNGASVPLRTWIGTSVRSSVIEGTAYLTPMLSCDNSSVPDDYVDDVVWTTSAPDRFLGADCVPATTGSKVADPRFSARASGDFRPAAGSPLIDAGDAADVLPALDQAGKPRVVDGNGDGVAVADIGAYERQ